MLGAGQGYGGISGLFPGDFLTGVWVYAMLSGRALFGRMAELCLAVTSESRDLSPC